MEALAESRWLDQTDGLEDSHFPANIPANIG